MLAQLRGRAALRDQVEFQQALLHVGLGSTPAQLGEHLAADIKRWGEVIARAKIPRQ